MKRLQAFEVTRSLAKLLCIIALSLLVVGALLCFVGAANSGAGHGPGWSGTIFIAGLTLLLAGGSLFVVTLVRAVFVHFHGRPSRAVAIVLLGFIGLAAAASPFLLESCMFRAIKNDEPGLCMSLASLRPSKLDVWLWISARWG